MQRETGKRGRSQDNGKAGVYRQADSDRDYLEARGLSPEKLGLVNDVGQEGPSVGVVIALDDDDKFGVDIGTECGRDDGTEDAEPGVKSRNPCGRQNIRDQTAQAVRESVSGIDMHYAW